MELTISTTIVAAATIIMALAVTFYAICLGVKNIMEIKNNKRIDAGEF